MSSDEQAIIDVAVAYTWALDTKQFEDLRNMTEDILLTSRVLL